MFSAKSKQKQVQQKYPSAAASRHHHHHHHHANSTSSSSTTSHPHHHRRPAEPGSSRHTNNSRDNNSPSDPSDSRSPSPSPGVPTTATTADDMAVQSFRSIQRSSSSSSSSSTARTRPVRSPPAWPTQAATSSAPASASSSSSSSSSFSSSSSMQSNSVLKHSQYLPSLERLLYECILLMFQTDVQIAQMNFPDFVYCTKHRCVQFAEHPDLARNEMGAESANVFDDCRRCPGDRARQSCLTASRFFHSELRLPHTFQPTTDESSLKQLEDVVVAAGNQWERVYTQEMADPESAAKESSKMNERAAWLDYMRLAFVLGMYRRKCFIAMWESSSSSTATAATTTTTTTTRASATASGFNRVLLHFFRSSAFRSQRLMRDEAATTMSTPGQQNMHCQQVCEEHGGAYGDFVPCSPPKMYRSCGICKQPVNRQRTAGNVSTIAQSSIHAATLTQLYTRDENEERTQVARRSRRS